MRAGAEGWVCDHEGGLWCGGRFEVGWEVGCCGSPEVQRRQEYIHILSLIILGTIKSPPDVIMSTGGDNRE